VNDRVFVDTNVLVYADDRSAAEKRTRALTLLGELIRESRAVLSTQVLQEYFVVATRKLGVPPELARQKVDALSPGPPAVRDSSVRICSTIRCSTESESKTRFAKEERVAAQA
jgi:predicted nucleic acid-binding protein